MDWLKRLGAWASPVALVVSIALVAMAPQPSRHRALVSAWVEVSMHAALILVLLQAIFVGSADEPKVVKWLNDDEPPAIKLGLRYLIVHLAAFAVLFAMKRVIRIKLDYDSITLLAGAFSAIVVSFELFGYWLTNIERAKAKLFRYAAGVWLIVAVAHSLLDGGNPRRWFPFGVWSADLYSGLISGQGIDWLALIATLAIGAISAAIFVRGELRSETVSSSGRNPRSPEPRSPEPRSPEPRSPEPRSPEPRSTEPPRASES